MLRILALEQARPFDAYFYTLVALLGASIAVVVWTGVRLISG